MSFSLLANISIILVEPAGPLNIGSVARVMKNMGLRNLVLVNPQCEHLGDEARQMAVHAGEVLAAARLVPTLPAALKGCKRAIATTGLHRTLVTTLEPPKQALPWLLGTVAAPGSAALIFGPEDRGLNNEELNYAHRFISIPANPDYPSLNLAQAVAVCCYELHEWVRQLESQDAVGTESESRPAEIMLGATHEAEGAIADPADLDRLEGFYHQLEALLLEIGYLHPHTCHSRMQKFRRLFNRAMPSDDEVAMLRGILSQMKWAKENPGRLPKSILPMRLED